MLSLKNWKFSEYLEFIYPRELEMKETSEIITSFSYLDLYVYIEKEKLFTKFYDKEDDFNFSIGGGKLWRMCRVPYGTEASKWDWLTVEPAIHVAGKRRGGNVFISSVHFHSCSFLHCPSLSSPLLYLLSFYLSLGDDTNDPQGLTCRLTSTQSNQYPIVKFQSQNSN